MTKSHTTGSDEQMSVEQNIYKALRTIAEWPITGNDNMDAENMKDVAVAAHALKSSTTIDVRNQALEEAALICDKSSLQPAIAQRIRALKSSPPATEAGEQK